MADDPSRLVIDTNIAIFLTKGSDNGRRARLAVESYAISVSFYTAAELFLTAKKAADPEATRDYWAERFDDGRISVLWPDLDMCQTWADVYAECKDAKYNPSLSDLWVAVTGIHRRSPGLNSQRQALRTLRTP